MNFPLDIIWIKDQVVVGFEKALQPEQEPYTRYASPAPVNIVVEVPADFVEQHAIQVGSKLRIYETN
jgi:uncharacterized membrane protein (UPF0127 family)